jgi:hypothetical protein
MAAVCPSILHFCRVRLTRLDSVGNVAAPPDNSYVSDGAISLQYGPEISTGEDRELKTGCGCIVASAKDPDILKRFNFELTMGKFEPALFEMLTGANVILAGTDPIGIDFPDQTDCNYVPSYVAFEGWADAYDGDAPDATRPYFYVVWPATSWQIGQTTLQNDFAQLPLTGFSRSNGQWLTGPYDDMGLAAPIGPTGSLVQVAEAPPDAACGYADIPVGS